MREAELRVQEEVPAEEVQDEEDGCEGCGGRRRRVVRFGVGVFGNPRFRFERPPASTTAARSANASAATAAAVEACSGPRVAVGSSSIGEMSGHRPSTDGVAPPAAVAADHKRNVSIQTPAARRDVSGVPVDTVRPCGGNTFRAASGARGRGTRPSEGE